jgi:hypothetical protein
MPTFVFDASVGGTMRLKVEAESLDRAMEIAEEFTIEDWENAGPMRRSDVSLEEVASSKFDHHLVDQAGAWGYGPDDDLYEEDDAATVPAGD